MIGESKKNVIVTSTGIVASSIVRALIPAGYNVKTLGLDESGLTVFKSLGKKLDNSPGVVEDILKGNKQIDLFE